MQCNEDHTTFPEELIRNLKRRMQREIAKTRRFSKQPLTTGARWMQEEIERTEKFLEQEPIQRRVNVNWPSQPSSGTEKKVPN